MACYRPCTMFRSPEPSEVTGEPIYRFHWKHGYEAVPTPCMKCVGCLSDRRQSWAIRIANEASLYLLNCMLTLSYAPEFLPADGSLSKRHLQLFFHRVRKHRERHPDAWGADSAELLEPVRYYGVGEYGDRSGRAHYHVAALGWRPVDGRPIAGSDPVAWRSPVIEDLWGMGHCRVDALTPDSAAYVAGYVAKKVGAESGELVDRNTGEVLAHRAAPFQVMSRRPGIGAGWIDRFEADVYPDDFMVVKGKKAAKPPKYYDNRVAARRPEVIQAAKASRAERGASPKRQEHSTPRRLEDREAVHRARLALKRRSAF